MSIFTQKDLIGYEEMVVQTGESFCAITLLLGLVNWLTLRRLGTRPVKVEMTGFDHQHVFSAKVCYGWYLDEPRYNIWLFTRNCNFIFKFRQA